MPRHFYRFVRPREDFRGLLSEQEFDVVLVQTVMIIIGHPESEGQNVEDSIRFAAAQGARVMLSEFAPIPGTPDGESCRAYTNLDEPLNHNKTAFTLRALGGETVNRLKALARGAL